MDYIMCGRSTRKPDDGMNLLTPKDAAQILVCSERLVLDELRRKNLRGSKTPAGWRIDEADLKTYIDSRANVRPVRKAAP